MRLAGVCAFVALVAAAPVGLEGRAGEGPEKSSPVAVKGGRLTFDPKTCTEGGGSLAWGLGSVSVRVLGREGDLCVFDYRWEVEGAGNYQVHRIRVPVNSGPVVIDHGVKDGGKEHFWSGIYTSFTAEQATLARRMQFGWFEAPVGKEFVKFHQWLPGDEARPALRGDKVTLRALVYLDDKFTNLAGAKWRRQSVVTRLGDGKEWEWAQAVAEGMTPYEVRRVQVPVKIAGPARDWLPGYDDGSTAYVELQLIAVERKEPKAVAQKAAELLKAHLTKFSLRIYGWGVKPERPGFRLVANKDLLKPGEEGAIVISEAQAREVIDALVAAGQFDRPQYVPPPGPQAPGWYLYVSIEDIHPQVFYWNLGGPEYDLSKDPVAVQLLKVLKGDAKKALERVVGPGMHNAADLPAEPYTTADLLPGGIADTDGKTAYLQGKDGKLAAVDLEQGADLWKTDAVLTPLGLWGRRLVTAAAVKDKPDQIRLVVLDLAKKGNELSESSPIVVSGFHKGLHGSVRVRGYLDGDALLLEWMATWTTGSGRPNELPTFGYGLTRVDLKSGKAATLTEKEKPALRPPLKLCARLEEALTNNPGQRMQFLNEGAWSPEPRRLIAGNRVGAIHRKQVEKGEQLILQTWDLRTGKDADTTTLLQRPYGLHFKEALDGRYVAFQLTPAKVQPGKQPDAQLWGVFGVAEKKCVGMALVDSNSLELGVSADRAFVLQDELNKEEPNQVLKAYNLQTGKLLWQRAAAGPGQMVRLGE